MRTLRLHAATQPRRSPPMLSLGQRLLLGGYVPLFALVLPFICWGALAEPDHPHRTPHFVFADPVLFQTPSRDTPMAEASRSTGSASHRQHEGKLRMATTPTSPAPICYQRPDTPVSGRATPTLLLFSVLLLLWLGDGAFPPRSRFAFARWLRPLALLSHDLPVPFPPPRPSFSALMAI